MPITLKNILTTGLATYIKALARCHGVEYHYTRSSVLAQLFIALSDDEVNPHETEKLIIALKKAQVIDGITMTTLLNRYLMK